MKWYLLWAFLWMSMTGTVLAADLNAGMIRLNRSQNGQSPLPIFVEFETDSLIEERGIRVSLGEAWNVNGVVKSSVANLPSGVLAVPNINSSGVVSGKSIEFSCDDLSPGVVYGFYISEGISSNSISGDNNYIWSIATLSSGGVDRQKNIEVPVSSNDQLVITGKVAANQGEMELNLGIGVTGILKQNQRVDFQVDYKSLMAGNINPLVVKVSWSRGTVLGSPIPNVDIFDYVVGSASEAYGGAVPVVDLINRTITWTINSYPPALGTNKVYFSLKTNDNYTSTSKVSVNVNSELLISNSIVITKGLNCIYQYIDVADTVGETPTLYEDINEKLSIEKIEVSELNNESAELRVVTNIKPDEVKIRYGLSTRNLGKSIISVNKLSDDRIKLDDLNPGAVYYFQVEASRSRGDEKTKSDIYTFTTTKTGQQVRIVPKSFVVTVQNSILFEASSVEVKDNVVVIPSEENYSVKIDLEKPELVKTAKIFVRDTDVLGITTVYGVEPASGESDLIEIREGKFSGQLRTSRVTNFYEIHARVTDIYGNMFEEIIGYVRVVEPLRVVDMKGKVLEGAMVKVWRFNEKNKTYELLPSRPLSPNPIFTNVYGSVNLALPMGKYRVEIESLNFASESVDFIVGIGEDEVYPKVTMSKRIISISQLVKYYGKILSDSLSYGNIFISELGRSSRFLRLMTLVQMGAACLFLLILLGKYFGVMWWVVPWWMIWILFNRNKKKGIYGKIFNEINNTGVIGAKVHLIDGEENRNLATATSGIGGEFYFDLIPAKFYKIFWSKKGYETPLMRDYDTQSVEGFLMELPLKKEKGFWSWLTSMEIKLIKLIYGIWAVMTIFLSYFFVKNIGKEAIYFLVMAIFNVILYSVFVIVFSKKNEEIS